MMRKRGLFVSLGSVPFWMIFIYLQHLLSNGPFGSEYGSSAYPMPPAIRLPGTVAVLLSFAGLFILAVDFEHLLKKRRLSKCTNEDRSLGEGKRE